jgi:hypothetical protein
MDRRNARRLHEEIEACDIVDNETTTVMELFAETVSVLIIVGVLDPF